MPKHTNLSGFENGGDAQRPSSLRGSTRYTVTYREEDGVLSTIDVHATDPRDAAAVAGMAVLGPFAWHRLSWLSSYPTL